MSKKKNNDPVTEAALSIVESEQMEEKLALTEQEKKEKTIAQIYKMMGRIEAAGLFEKVAVTSTFVWMKQVKKSQLYKKIPEIGSWKIFCNTMGYNRRYVDEQLQNLDAFGEKLLEVYRQFSLSHKDLRKLRKSVSDGEMIVDSETIEINGEKIPFTPDYSEDMQAAIESLLEEKDRQLENKDATIKAKDRVLEEKEKVINKQEKELSKFERRIKARGFEPGEENFIRDMENIKIMLVGVLLKMDARNMPKNMTPLMRAAWIENLGHFKRTIIAYYDEATNLGGIEDDDDWVPPYEREGYHAPGVAKAIPGNQLEAENQIKLGTVDCNGCGFHKGMMNKVKGVKIPGNSGKCTRPEGICFSEAAARAIKVQGDIAEDAE